jgi:ferric-dicitrate binding protein FerR (iron transport regulator)
MSDKRTDKRDKVSGSNDPLNHFVGGSVKWNKSRDRVWAEMEDKMDADTNVKVVKIRSRFASYVAAAIIVALFGITSIMRFYSRSYNTLPGELYALALPDGSIANLNSSSHITYNPYWWYISRRIELEGEAFFEVEKGEPFEVISTQGTTTVLGTSFNILTIDGQYEVTCVTGSVKVVATVSGDEVILTPDQRASLGDKGIFDVSPDIDVKESTAWRSGEFYFTTAPLDEVFKRIALQYGIEIEYSEEETYYYTGYFKKEKEVENILNLVCQPFGIKFDATSDGVYRITHNE